MENQEIKVAPIGHVRAKEGNFYLELNKKYIPALTELNGFSHINVVWWAHLCDDEKSRQNTLEIKTPYKKAPEKVGIFATRSPLRPNPISITAVYALKIDKDKGIITIPYIDAEDGTPILDLKPYHPCVDRIREVSVPEWCNHWPKWLEDSAEFDWESEFTFSQ